MVTVIIPAYNEEAIIADVVAEFYQGVVERIPDAEMIVVNDCSTDGTLAVLEALARDRPRLRVLTTPKNGGHGNALRAGFAAARTEWVFYTDGDGQTRPEDFRSLDRLRETADYITGVRTDRRDGWGRAVISLGLRCSLFLVFGQWVRDANCPYKLVRREVMDDLLGRLAPDVWVPMVMTTVLAPRLGYRLAEVPIAWRSRRTGRPSVAGWRRWWQVGRRCHREFRTLRRTLAAIPAKPDAPGRPSPEVDA